MGISHDRHVPTWDGSPSGPNWNAGGDMLGRGLGDGLRGFVGDLSNALKGIFAPGGMFAPIGLTMQEFRDGQMDLAERQDLIDRLLNYGSCYNPVAPRQSSNTWFRIPFTKQIGASRGVEVLSTGGLRLLHAGLWDIRSQIVSTSASGLLERWITWEVRVLSPGGAVHSRQIGKIVGRSSGHSTIVSSVMVEDPNYTVEVWCYSQNYYGPVVGYGPAYCRLTAQQVNSGTIGDGGAGDSGLGSDTDEG